MDGGINRHQPLHYVTNNYLEPWHKLHTTQSTAIYIRILFLLHCLFASASLAGFSSTISAPVRQKNPQDHNSNPNLWNFWGWHYYHTWMNWIPFLILKLCLKPPYFPSLFATSKWKKSITWPGATIVQVSYYLTVRPGNIFVNQQNHWHRNGWLLESKNGFQGPYFGLKKHI